MSLWTSGRHAFAAIGGPVSLLLMPKCPLCVLPVLAALGIGAPPGLVINVLVGFIAVGWIWLVFSAASSILLRASSLVVTALLVAGRAFTFIPAATYAVVAVMIVLGGVAARRCKKAECSRKAISTPQ